MTVTIRITGKDGEVARTYEPSQWMEMFGRTLVSSYSQYEGLVIRTSPPTRLPVNSCPTCHRFDEQEVVARSWEEAAELGWIVEVDRPTPKPSS